MSDDFHLYRRDRRDHWRDIAARIRAQPGVLNVPLANIDRWLTKGRLHPGPLLEWQRRIIAAQAKPAELAHLLAYLEADNHDAEPLKSCSPFVGPEFLNPVSVP
ncbi:MAG: hypothetical protein NTW21_33045 [Verrucomicrobia bacterium]|nr:hypothetical protein [Verrucomicrobiota bacterium]